MPYRCFIQRDGPSLPPGLNVKWGLQLCLYYVALLKLLYLLFTSAPFNSHGYPRLNQSAYCESAEERCCLRFAVYDSCWDLSTQSTERASGLLKSALLIIQGAHYEVFTQSRIHSVDLLAKTLWTGGDDLTRTALQSNAVLACFAFTLLGCPASLLHKIWYPTMLWKQWTGKHC